MAGAQSWPNYIVKRFKDSRGGQPVALSHKNATEASICATGGFGK